MKRRMPRLLPAATLSALDSRAIDALYGLEPVFEPGGSTDDPVQVVTIGCPYCGEDFITTVDVSHGASSYVEDCQVCCQPIDMQVDVDDNGALRAIQASRQN